VIKSYHDEILKSRKGNVNRRNAVLSKKLKDSRISLQVFSDESDLEKSQDEDDMSGGEEKDGIKGTNGIHDVRIWKMLLEKFVKVPAAAQLLSFGSSHDRKLEAQLHLFAKDLHESWRDLKITKVSSQPKKVLRELLKTCLDPGDNPFDLIPPFFWMPISTASREPDSKRLTNSLRRILGTLTQQLSHDPTRQIEPPKTFKVQKPSQKHTVQTEVYQLSIIVGDVTIQEVLQCIVQQNMQGLEDARAQNCRDFVSFFFGINFPKAFTKTTSQLYYNERYAFLHYVAENSKVADMMTALKTRFWIHKEPVSEELEELATVVAQQVIMEEWLCAKAAAESPINLSSKKKALIELRYGSYTVDAFHRVVRAAFLLGHDYSSLAGQLVAASPLCQDLSCICAFAEGCIARMEIQNHERREAAVQEILDCFGHFPMLKNNAFISCVLETLGALRVFFRIVTWHKNLDDIRKEELLLMLETAVFTPKPPVEHFVFRIPIMILGRLWPKVYKLFQERVLSVQQYTLELSNWIIHLDRTMLFRLILYKPCGAPYEDIEVTQVLLSSFSKKLDSITYHEFINCSKSNLCERSKKYYFFLNREEIDCWNDPQAHDILLRFIFNDKKTFFSSPYSGSFRHSELLQHIGKHGISLMYSPYTSCRLPSSDCTKWAPLSVRLFARNHSDYFSLLPMCYRISNKDITKITWQLHDLGISCWFAGKLENASSLQQRHELFPSRHIQLNGQAQFGDLFRHPDRDGMRLIGKVEELQHVRIFERISCTDALTQTLTWSGQLKEILSTTYQVGSMDLQLQTINVVVFEDDDYEPLLKEGVLTLSSRGLSESISQRLLKHLQARQVAVFLQTFCGERRLLYKLRRSGFSPCYRYGIVLEVDWDRKDLNVLRKYIDDADKARFL